MLVRELKGLCLDVELLDRGSKPIDVQTAEEMTPEAKKEMVAQVASAKERAEKADAKERAAKEDADSAEPESPTKVSS